MASPDARQFGDLATQLIRESRRSTQTDTLLKYNDVLVRSIIREQRDLENLINDAITNNNNNNNDNNAATAFTGDDSPALLLYQTAILRNKRCLLAYHAHRLDRLKDLYWTLGAALPALLAADGGDLRARVSPHEVDFMRGYNASVMHHFTTTTTTTQGDDNSNNNNNNNRRGSSSRGDFSEVDVTASIVKPPRDIHALVRVVRDCGVVETEAGTIDFGRGGKRERFMVRRADVEHLIVQGYLEEV